MAPVAISESPEPQFNQNGRPTVFFMDNFVQPAIDLASSKFNVVLPADPEHKNWRDAEYLLIKSSRFTAEDVAQCPDLRAIGKQGVGIDKIDAAACAARGIKIFNTPGVNARAVAELVLSLTTSLARQVRPLSLRIASGEVVRKETCSGLILHKCTIGIIGMGNIGHTVAKIFQGAFESQIIAYDPYMSQDCWSDIKHRRVSNYEELLKASDVVTCHVPLTAETENMISYPQFQIMKRNALLVNTARGGIVNENDLCTALEERLIWGAGLDCHTQEPPTQERYERLWKQPNVISLPHVGAATTQTQIETACAAVERLHQFAVLSG